MSTGKWPKEQGVSILQAVQVRNLLTRFLLILYFDIFNDLVSIILFQPVHLLPYNGLFQQSYMHDLRIFPDI